MSDARMALVELIEKRADTADPPGKRGRPCERGSNRHRHPSRSAGVRGTARWKGDAGHRGRPVSTGAGSPPRRTGGGSDGSRRGPYDRGGRVMLAEERALTSGALWREPRIGDWR